MFELKEMLLSNTPFAIMQYFESFKCEKAETQKQYEILFMKRIMDKKTEEVNYYLSFRVLTRKEVLFFKQNIDKIKLILDNKDGKVYEFNNFKEYKESFEISKLINAL